MNKVIKTNGDARLFLLTVDTENQCFMNGKNIVKHFKELCLLVETPIYHVEDDDEETVSIPVLLDKEGAKQLIEELELFIKQF